MATPHVSGAAAILAQQHPGWTGQQLKEQLMSSAKGLAGVLAVRGRHRPPRRGGRRHATPCAAPARCSSATTPGRTSRATRAVTKDLVLHQRRRHGRHARPGADRRPAPRSRSARRTVTVPAGGKATVPVTGDPTAVGLGPQRRLRRRHRRRDRHAGDPHLAGAAQGGRALRPRPSSSSTATASPPPGGSAISMAGDPWPWSEYVDGRDDPAAAARHLLGDDLPRRRR